MTIQTEKGVGPMKMKNIVAMTLIERHAVQ